jgi:hypothetical protein
MPEIVLASASAQAGRLGYPRSVTPSSLCTHALVAGACAATLLLSACGKATLTVTPSSSTSASAGPPSGARPFAGTGFRTNIPSGWTDETGNQTAVAALGGSGTVLMLLAAPDGGLIDVRTTSQPVPDDQLAQYLVGVTPQGATAQRSAEPVDIDGISGVFITYETLSPAGAPLASEDLVANQGGNSYEIKLQAPQPDFAVDRPALQEILDSWTWG